MRKVRANMFSSRRSKRLFPFALLILILTSLLIAGCDSGASNNPTPIAPTTLPTVAPVITPQPLSTATTVATPSATPIPVAERGFVPIFCYHQIRDWVKSDIRDDHYLIISPADLEAELKWLKEAGYHSVSSEQVYQYYANGRALPDKPVMLSFDDGYDTQYTNALPLLRKYGFKATFFIMTVSVGQENFMTATQLKELDQEGHDLQPHTWNHSEVTKYKTDEEWQQQIVEPKAALEKLLGHPTPYFAYPDGAYNAQAAEKIKSYGYKAAFRLKDVEDTDTDPLFAIKRYIANSLWDLDQFKVVAEGGWEK